MNVVIDHYPLVMEISNHVPSLTVVLRQNVIGTVVTGHLLPFVYLVYNSLHKTRGPGGLGTWNQSLTSLKNKHNNQQKRLRQRQRSFSKHWQHHGSDPIYSSFLHGCMFTFSYSSFGSSWLQWSVRHKKGRKVSERSENM